MLLTPQNWVSRHNRSDILPLRYTKILPAIPPQLEANAGADHDTWLRGCDMRQRSTRRLQWVSLTLAFILALYALGPLPALRPVAHAADDPGYAHSR